MRRKTKRLLAGILAVVFVLSSIQMTTLTANAEEVVPQSAEEDVLDDTSDVEDVVDPNADPNADLNADSNAEPNADSNADPNADPNADLNADSNAEPNADSNADPNADSNVDPNADPNADPNVDPNADPNVDPNADPNVDPNADPNADPNVDPNADSNVDPNADSNAESDETENTDPPMMFGMNRSTTTDGNVISYVASNTSVDWGNATYDYADDGRLKIDFANAFDQVKIRLPESVDMSKVTAVKFFVSDQTAEIALKIWGDEESEASICEYNFKDGTEYTITPSSTQTINVIGIMGQEAGTVYFDGVEFTVDNEEESSISTVSYAASNTSVDWGNATYDYADDGRLKIDFANAFDQVKIRLPESVDMSKVTAVKFFVSDQTAEIALKIWGDEESEASICEYNFKDGTEYTITPSSTQTISVIGIMGQEAGTVYFDGVEFTIDNSIKKDDDTETANTTDITYNFKDLEKINSYGVALNVGDGGELAIDFEKQYQESFYSLPNGIDGAKVKKVELVLTSGNNVVIKLYPNTDGSGEPQVNYSTSITPSAEFKSFGIMTTYNGASSARISGVKFTVADSVENLEINKTYSLMNLYAEKKNNEVTATENGEAVTLDYAGNFKEIFFKIPKEIDSSKLHKVTFNVSSDNGSDLAYKFYTEDNYNGDWPSSADERTSYNNPVAVIQSGFAGMSYFGVMSMVEATSVTIDSVTFHTTGWGYSEPSQEEEDSEGGVKVFTADDLTFSWADPDGEGIYEKKDGKWVVNFTGKQYAQVAFNLPESINLANCTEVKFTIADQTVPVALKLLKNGTEVEAETRYSQKDATEYVFAPNTTETINGVGIMYGDGTPAGGETASLVSVAFTMKGSSDVSYGDNIIKNPNFAEEDISMWDKGVTKATISRETSDTAIFDDVTTYGKIDRDASWVEGTQDARHEFFVQDITENVNIGSEYKVEFYAKLSDDYAGANEDQRVVEFAPYFETADGPQYLGASYSSQLGGKLSQTLEAGKWTKFEGTFNVTHDADITGVVIRIIEQGTKYGSIAEGGQCVKGDYYITGVSMKEIIKPEVTIETDIPNWKDAITGAFGKDAIAGTCLGSGTITYEYLQALAKKHFNAITFENEQKPDATLSNKNEDGTPMIGADGYPVYNFTTADRMMKQIHDWNVANEGNFKIRGHVLVWHSQTPEWFFHVNYDTNQPYVDKDTMNKRMEHYIKSVFEHYDSVVYEDGSKASDLFYGWDVVNEAISDSTAKPRMASENSSWAAVYGDQSNEYIINAFRYANKYAPAHVELYYNDYNDSNEPKASGIAALLAEITSHEKDANMPTRISGVGMQAHHNFADPSVSQIKAAANKYLDALGEGGTVQMTELDVKCSSTFDGTAATLESEHNKQAWRFKEIFDAYRDIETARPGSVAGITMWGITDETSWLQSSNSVGGASSGGAQAPLLFYVDNYVAKAKPAFYAFFDEYVANLAPMIQNVTVLQQLEAGKFDSGNSYNVAGVADFVPMWTKDGLTIKVSVDDNTVDGAYDKVTVYIDEAGSKSEGNYAKITLDRNSAGVTSTAEGYEAIINIPMSASIAKTFSMDISVDNNGAVSVFNDKKGTQAVTSQYYAEAIMKPYATVDFGKVTIDGEADAAWNNVTAIPLSIVNKAEASATVKALWDADYLYLYADIKDTILDATGKETHEQDSVEVFIDENNAKSDGYEDDDKQYRVNYLNEQSYKGTKCNAENMISAVKVVEGGYVVEAAYKWTDITPSADMEIGLEFQINDAKNGARTGTASWYDESGMGWSSPSVFGTVKLVDSTATPPTGPSTGGNSSGDSSSDSSSSGGSSTPAKPAEKPVETPEIEIPVIGGDIKPDTPVEDITPTIPSEEETIPEALKTVVEQLQVLVDDDATLEEKVEAVQEVIDTVKELSEEGKLKEFAKEAIETIEESIKEALGIDVEVEHEGDDVPKVKNVIGALLSVDAGKHPKLRVKALGTDNTPEPEKGFVNGFPLDIKLLADDKEIQPNVPVTIRLDIPKGIDKDKEIKVIHFGKKGTNTLDVNVFGDEMEFTTDGFSTFVVVNVESATAGTELAIAEENTTAEMTDNNDTNASAIEEKADDNGFTPFIIIVIIVVILAIATAGFFMLKNKNGKEE